MNDRELIQHLMDIKERLSTIEAKQDMHIEQHAVLRSQVSKHATEITKAQASLKTLKWVAGILFVTLPATAAAIAKIWRP